MISHLVTLAAPNGCPLSPPESGGGFFGPIAKPLAAVLAAFYHVVPSYGVAILALSVAWMIIISPLTLKSTRSMLAMQKIQPEIKRLQEKHKNDRQAFAQAQMDLFKERGVSPFGSCLPTLLPLPVFFALFRLIDGLSHKTKGCPNPQFLSPHTQMFHDIVKGGGTLHSFGLNLAQDALSHHTSFVSAIPFFVLLLIMGGTQYLQTQQMMSRNPAASDNPQMRMMKYLPLIFMVFCIRFPAGVVLYYSMSNLCRIAQQSLMYRFDPKVRTLAARDVIDVESYTEEHEEEHRRERAQGKGGSGKALPASGKGGKTEASDDDKPARSRFSALLDAAREQKAQDMEKRAQAKEARGKPAAGAKSGGGGKTPAGGKSAGSSKAGGGKAPARPKGAAGTKAGAASGGGGGGGGGGGRQGGKNRPSGGDRSNAEGSSNTGGNSSSGGNGNRAAKANSAAKGASPRSGGQRTGAGNRTGARPGGNKKRRGR